MIFPQSNGSALTTDKVTPLKLKTNKTDQMAGFAIDSPHPFLHLRRFATKLRMWIHVAKEQKIVACFVTLL